MEAASPVFAAPSDFIEAVSNAKAVLSQAKVYPNPRVPGQVVKDTDAAAEIDRELSVGYAPGTGVPHWRTIHAPIDSEDLFYGFPGVRRPLPVRVPLLALHSKTQHPERPLIDGTVSLGADDCSGVLARYTMELLSCVAAAAGGDGDSSIVDMIGR